MIARGRLLEIGKQTHTGRIYQLGLIQDILEQIQVKIFNNDFLLGKKTTDDTIWENVYIPNEAGIQIFNVELTDNGLYAYMKTLDTEEGHMIEKLLKETPNNCLCISGVGESRYNGELNGEVVDDYEFKCIMFEGNVPFNNVNKLEVLE